MSKKGKIGMKRASKRQKDMTFGLFFHIRLFLALFALALLCLFEGLAAGLIGGLRSLSSHYRKVETNQNRLEIKNSEVFKL